MTKKLITHDVFTFPQMTIKPLESKVFIDMPDDMKRMQQRISEAMSVDSSLLSSGLFSTQTETHTNGMEGKDIIAALNETMAGLGPPAKPVYYSPFCSEDTDERLFPKSRHRSKRILKKLVKRFGGIYRKKPCVYEMENAIFAHTSLKPLGEFHNVR